MKTPAGDWGADEGRGQNFSLRCLVSVLSLAVAAPSSGAQLTSGPWEHHLRLRASRPRGGSSFPLQLIPGWPPCLPGALSAVRPRPVPAPNSRRGCCLPVWTLQKQWPFCYSHGPLHSLFLLSLARIQNAPTLFTRTSLPSSGLASPEPPWLQIPGQAVPLHGKHRAGAGARGARSRLTSPSRSAERSLLTLIQPPGLRGRVVASRFPAWQISLLLDNSDIGCQYLIRLKSPWRAVDSSRAWHWALCAVYLARALFSLSKPSPLQRAPEAL